MQPLVLLAKNAYSTSWDDYFGWGSGGSDSDESFLPAATSSINDRQFPSAPSAASAASYGGDFTNYIYTP